MVSSATGQNLANLESREAVHHSFGSPIAEGSEEGQRFEEYETRRRIAEPLLGSNYGLSFAMTFGLSEVVNVPLECFRQTTDLSFGQTVRFYYDASGKMTSFQVKRHFPRFDTYGPFPRSLTSPEEDSSFPAQKAKEKTMASPRPESPGPAEPPGAGH